MTQGHKGIFSAVPPQSQYTPVPPPLVPFHPQQVLGVPRSLEVHVGVMTDPDATVATATLSDGGGGFGPAIMVKTGSSKRTPGDSHDAETAAALAVGRALIRLGRELEKQANGKVKHADNVRKAKKAATGAASEARKAAEVTGAWADKVDKVVRAGMPEAVAGILREHSAHGDDIQVTMIPLSPESRMPDGFSEKFADAFPEAKFAQAPYPFDQDGGTVGGIVGSRIDAFIEEYTGQHRRETEEKHGD